MSKRTHNIKKRKLNKKAYVSLHLREVTERYSQGVRTRAHELLN